MKRPDLVPQCLGGLSLFLFLTHFYSILIVSFPLPIDRSAETLFLSRVWLSNP